jgi:hypothetical protein
VNGALWHSGDAPLHAFELALSGVGDAEVREAVAWLSISGDEDANLTLHRDAHGFSMRLAAEATRAQAMGLIDRLYEARELRGRAEAVGQP